jgi:hypothetical protein
MQLEELAVITRCFISSNIPLILRIYFTSEDFIYFRLNLLPSLHLSSPQKLPDPPFYQNWSEGKFHPITSHEDSEWEQLYSFFNLGARWECVVKTTPRPLYVREGDRVPILQETGSATVPVWTGAKKLAPPGFFYVHFMTLNYITVYKKQEISKHCCKKTLCSMHSVSF